MSAQDSVLVQLVRLVERIPTLPPPPRRRGRPIVYSDGLFLKALIIMIVRRIHRVGELLAVLEEPTPEMRALREVLTENGRFPTRRTFSSAGCAPCQRRFQRGSGCWDATWWGC
jgi:hypothetical protein